MLGRGGEGKVYLSSCKLQPDHYMPLNFTHWSFNSTTQYYTKWPMKMDIFAAQEKQAIVEIQIVNKRK